MDPILPEPIRETGNASPAPAENISSTETSLNTNVERSREGAPTVSMNSASSAAATSSITHPASPAPTQQQTQNQPQPTDVPLIADDVDVIEKEWVDKAKKIVSATKTDPHTQEKEVSKLQADYLMKRYNKKLKVNE